MEANKFEKEFKQVLKEHREIGLLTISLKLRGEGVLRVSSYAIDNEGQVFLYSAESGESIGHISLKSIRGVF